MDSSDCECIFHKDEHRLPVKHQSIYTQRFLWKDSHRPASDPCLFMQNLSATSLSFFLTYLWYLCQSTGPALTINMNFFRPTIFFFFFKRHVFNQKNFLWDMQFSKNEKHVIYLIKMNPFMCVKNSQCTFVFFFYNLQFYLTFTAVFLSLYYLIQIWAAIFVR